MALQPGVLSLPSSEIVWWDTRSDSLRRTALPATSISVTGTAITPKSGTATRAATPEQSSSAKQMQQLNSTNEINNAAKVFSTNRLTPALLGNLGLSLVVLAVGWLSWRYAQRPNQKRRRALERSRTELIKEIQNRNFDNIQRLVSDYLELRYGQTQNKAREIWIKEQPEAATLLQLLDQSSYDQKSRTPSQDTILQLATNLLSKKSTKTQKEKRRALLPALYPETR